MSTPLRHAALEIFQAGVEATQPERLLRERSRVDGECWLWDDDLSFDLPQSASGGRLLVLGAGKAAAWLARPLEETLGERIAAGRIIVKHGHGLPLARIRVEEGGHPVPDAAGFAATARLLRDLGDPGPADRVLFLLTGGASALLVAPAPGLTLADKVSTTRLLLGAGATIQETNAVRKHLSAVKGGRLAARLAPAEVLTLVISDVVGDDLSAIGSGPTAPDSTTFAQSIEILARYHLLDRVPPAVRDRLQGHAPETPKPGDPAFDRVQHVVLAGNGVALDAACQRAAALGFAVEVFARDLTGSTHEQARAFATRLKEMASHDRGRPLALLAGGETTLAVTGMGLGGRNQEFALVAAREIAGNESIVILAAGTDGSDGPTDAAGAYADGTTLDRARSHGLDPEAILLDNDVYRLIDRLGDLLHTGPTGTNVADLVVGLTA
ncbi:MAG: glycerate kinase [Chloroflexi bacterium]|nr:glycerate kinase [Chloroflexota bacterium]